jgi:outer membrane protein assembly factor BamB
VNGVPLVFYGGGDGWCYAFDARPTPAQAGRPGILKTVWRYNCNPDCLRSRDGESIRYNTEGDGPSEIIATPVFYKNRVYVAVGQDPAHGRGKGCLSCIDATQTGDVTAAAELWSYTGIDRSLSTVAISHGRVYAADYSGRLHCLDAETGNVLWVYETDQPTWGSPLVADGKIYLGTTRGFLHVLEDSAQRKVLSCTRIGAGIHSTPVAANGALYVMTRNRLLVFGQHPGSPQPSDRIGLARR